MDEVSRLFKSYRDGKLKLDGLTNALIKLMDEKPNFGNRAVNVLDQIQQRVPIPVTDYIEVRTEIDHACRIRVNTPPTGMDGPDPDATLIYAGELEAEEQNTDDGLATKPGDQHEAEDITAAGHTSIPGDVVPEEDIEATATATAQHTFMRPNAAANEKPAEPRAADKPEANNVESNKIAAKITAEPEDIAPDSPVLESARQPQAAPNPETPETTVGVGQKIVAKSKGSSETQRESQNVPEARVETPSQPTPEMEMESDATVIMPIAAQMPHQGSTAPAASPSAVSAPSPIPEVATDTHAEEATLIVAPTHQPKVAPQSSAAPIANKPDAVPQATADKSGNQTTQPKQNRPRSILPLIVVGCVVVGAAAIGGGLLLFGSNPSETPSNELQSNQSAALPETYPEQSVDPNDPNARPMDNSFTNEADIADSTLPEEIIEEAPAPVAKPKPRVKTLAETLDELGSEQAKLDYLFTKLQKAADTRDLLPVDRKNSATFYLIEMLKVNRHHHMISQGRAYIAQMHLEAAREARTEGKWDDAQEHLDAALEVRLPDSFMPK